MYSLGIWLVKTGQEEEFIAAWTEFAKQTFASQPGAIEVVLLRDIENPSRFITAGPWEDQESIDRWRQTKEFQEFFQRAKLLCKEITPFTLKILVKLP